jgi:hypothetical protein
MRHALLSLLVLLGTVAVALASVPRPRSPVVVTESEPDTRKAATREHWPTDEEFTRLVSAVGQSRAQVLRLLGHPRRVQRWSDGREAWEYPLLAACFVSFEKGRCTSFFYTGGY